MLKPEYFTRQSQHNEILALLAEVGKGLEYKIWIGKKEQSGYADGLINHKKLSDYVTTDINKITNAQNLDTVGQIDLLWIKSNKIVSSFEIEFTTSMTSGLVRGSNIKSDVQKYLVLPEEREEQFKRKHKSPMFSERFKDDNWNLLFFDAIKIAYKKLKGKEISLESIINKKGPKSLREAIKEKKIEKKGLFDS
jgi:hypothetical protein